MRSQEMKLQVSKRCAKRSPKGRGWGFLKLESNNTVSNPRVFTAPEAPTLKVEELQANDISQGARKTRSKPKANRRREKIKR